MLKRMASYEASREEGYAPLLVIPTQTSTSKGDFIPEHETREVWNEDEDNGSDNMDIVQFTTTTYFAEEDESSLGIDIMRIGSLEGSLKVSYETISASAHGGQNFRAEEGIVTFEEGEHAKEIRIEILDPGIWSTTLEFLVRLRAVENCHLGLHLHCCRVKIIDKDMFPSNKYRALLTKGLAKEVNPNMLFLEFAKLVFVSGGCAYSTALTLVMDQLSNAYTLLTIWINMYLVNSVLNVRSDPLDLLLPSRQETLILVCFMLVAPNIFLTIWQKKKLQLDVPGKASLFMRTNLSRRFLNYTEESRGKVSASAMQSSVYSDAEELGAGYAAALNLVTQIGKQVMNLAYIACQNPDAIPLMILMPCVMISWMFVRETIAHRVKGATEARHSLMDILTEACLKYDLIADYEMKENMNDIVEHRSENVAIARIPKALFKLHTELVLQWVGPVMSAAFMYLQGLLVVEGRMTLGDFLATVLIIRNVASDMLDAYMAYEGMTATFKPLLRVTKYLNLETDLMYRKRFNRARRQESNAAMQSMSLKSFASGRKRSDFADPDRAGGGRRDMNAMCDMLPIALKSVCWSSVNSDVTLKDINARVPQGHTVLVFGPPHSGKGTLLRLIAKRQQATSGQVLVSSHLRTLQVAQGPVLLNLSCFENLVFGIRGKQRIDIRRVIDICAMLELWKVLDMVKDDLEREAGESMDDYLRAAVAKAPKESHVNQLRSASNKPLRRSDCRSEGSDLTPPGTPRIGTKAMPPVADSMAAKTQLSWQKTMSHTETCLIHLARAFIMSPELMVMQKPLSMYGSAFMAGRVSDAMFKFVKERGLCDNPATRHRRRPRTLFYSADDLSCHMGSGLGADIIWKLASRDDSNGNPVCTLMDADDSDFANALISV
eukprot:TRINITY_DN34179_c0_g1_i1.p1 TRINITY_DN34179_c0_g1~~TRINITY_DN34179_c0_g1_i1.p1  ORF type:complete len:889 (-),score=196.30 TRINITY_DN34179_c0_g1_i1:98-2764(-)